ncbi:HAMP domain-containing histidine kinase [Nakamurella flava]|uniref:histidine kinase n=1 Tax=Nakamurella flava TaxID=2576308 RepID=A0A4U6QJV8_9ACTN|nr:HAMP domain-containing sensor histidine kinase [Nakamurella flava]TKV60770.1 HAMP domain-containing histidine kinase [Nakamurella flava]
MTGWLRRASTDTDPASARTDPDRVLLRRATTRMAWQLAAASAVVVVLAGLTALLISPLVRDHHGGRPGGPDRDDEILRDLLLIAAVVGVAIAGVVGFLIARRAVAPLGEALARQRRFVADAGHELRTPLTVMHTRAQLIARRMPPDDPSLPAMHQLLDDSRVLREIVDELLASAALTGDPSAGEPVRLRPLLSDIAASMGDLARQGGVRIEMQAPDDLTVVGAPIALRRAVSALVDNALGHTPAGGTVELAAVRDGTGVVVAVTDDGEGFGDQDPQELTRRFARGSRSADGPGGRRFGLGLALVREVAVAHGGELVLRPGPTGGARAELHLPARTG